MSTSPIAVIGLACRLPGASSPRQFWQLLADGTESIGPVPDSRISPAELASLTELNPGARFGAYLDQIDEFDAEFFGISPREATAMDPQQRLLLELAWELWEDSGLLPSEVRGSRCGVFIGALADEYAALSRPNNIGRHTLAGTTRAVLANRISHFFDLHGPSIAIDTAQSSSLVAVHFACDSLHRGESEIAIAGGVNLIVDPSGSRVVAEFGGMSPTGQCHVLDESADGYVRGEGAGLVLLKPLDQAIADGDRIYSVILGGAVNSDGGTDSLTVPDSAAQGRVIASARAEAGVTPEQVQYVELHGTGTPVGDRAEVAGLRVAANVPIEVGSVKTNIGHLEGAAGVAGLLKVVLSIWRRQLPKSLNYGAPRSDIDLGQLQVRVDFGDWPQPDSRLIAGVSSFGMGGTNCHLVLGEPPTTRTNSTVPQPASDSQRHWEPPLLVSARSRRSLASHADAVKAILPQQPPAQVAKDLATTRTAFPFRAAISGNWLEGLDALARGGSAPNVAVGQLSGRPLAIGMLFPGQGSQRVGMGKQAYRLFPEFRQAFDEVVSELGPALPQHVWDDEQLLGRTKYTQPALFAIEVASYRLLRSWGVEPTVVAGHSIGEVAAAHIAGMMDLPSAASLIVARGVLMDSLPSGGVMASIRIAEETVAPLLAGRKDVGFGAINGAGSIVLSGSAAAVSEVVAALKIADDQVRWLRVSHAFHSPLMEPILDQFAEVATSLTYSPATLPFVSAVTGQVAQHVDADYWVDHARAPVRFAQALATVGEYCSAADKEAVLIETGPGAALTALAGAAGLRSVPLLGKRGDLAEGVAGLYVAGVPADWRAIYGQPQRHVADGPTLPTYRFDRQRYWLADNDVAAAAPEHETVRPVAAYSDSRSADLFDVNTDGDVVGAQVAAVLGYANHGDVPQDTVFTDLGMDSLGVVELRDRLASSGIELTTADIYSYPTIEALTGWIRGSAAGAVTGVPVAAAADDDPVVIVGMGCRYPGDVRSPDDLWRLVTNGVDAITDFPGDRGWDLDRLADASNSGASHTQRGGFVRDAALFDPAFFGISPREALAADPQQRLLLHTVWEALERAGIDPKQLRDTATGVYIGATSSDYTPRLDEGDPAADGYLLTGGTPAVASGRIAYALGLSGPALTVDTACSSSLVALDLAVRSVRSGTTTLAIAGGATVLATPGMFVEFSRQRGLSADGRCRAFGADADGTGWAEGVGVVVVERLSAARAAGHRVLAVVAGTAVNSDGASNGLTAPSGAAQQRVIGAALADAGLGPDDVDVVEAHGTGTTLGDPIEAQALVATYGARRQQPLVLGSLKSNIGHSQAAAGIGGVIKMVQALRHGEIPRTLWVDNPTPHIDWPESGLVLADQHQTWPQTSHLRRAAVSAFGISGTNAHVILQQAPPEPPVDTVIPRPAPPIVLSAPDQHALSRQAAVLLEHLDDIVAAHRERSDAIAAIAHTLLRRTRHQHAAVLAPGEDVVGTRHALQAIATGDVQGSATAVTRSAGKTVFVFPGQGAQWAQMACGLLEEKVFRSHIQECEEAFAAHVDWSLQAVLRGESTAPSLDRVDVVQPTLFAVMTALAALWRHHGVEPDAVVGHSQGEIAAAYVAGALTLADAARLVTRRSLALTKIAGDTSMMSIAADIDRLREPLERWADTVSVAADNGPSALVVAGPVDHLDEIAAWCDRHDIRAKRVAVNYASHSKAVDPLRQELLSDFADLQPHATSVSFYSSVQAASVAGSQLDAHYWYDNLRQQVRFADAIRALIASGHRKFIEVSPHPILTGGVDSLLAVEQTDGAALSTLRRDHGSPEDFAHAVAVADMSGVPVRWALGAPAELLDSEVPPYAFAEQRFWLTPRARHGANGFDGHPLLTTVVELADGGAVATATINPAVDDWVAEHRVLSRAVVPATAILELVAAAGRAVGTSVISELSVTDPIPASATVDVQVRFGGADADGRRAVSLHARIANQWSSVAHGTAGAQQDAGTASAAVGDTVELLDVSTMYERLYALGYDYGPRFATVVAAERTTTGVSADVSVIDSAGFAVHPATLDAALHPVVAGLTSVAVDEHRPLLPFAVEGVRLPRNISDVLRVHLSVLADRRVGIRFTDVDGQEVGSIDSISFRPAPTAVTQTPSVYHVDFVNPAGPDTAGSLDPDSVAVLATAGETSDIVIGGRVVDHTSSEVTIAPVSSTDPDVPTAAEQACLEVLEVLSDVGDENSGTIVIAVRADDLAMAAVIGLTRSAAVEHPGRVALAVVDGPVDAHVLAAVTEPETRFVSGVAQVPRLIPDQVPAEVTSSDDTQSWPGAGTTILTGGSGALGAVVARHLAKIAPDNRVLLVSRSGVNEPLVSELRAAGADVETVACDVTDRASVAELIAGIDVRRPLRAVVHAAGVLDDATVSAMTADQLHAALDPKVKGAWYLHELTAHLPLERFVLFSSVVGTVGAPGQANYAAANAFLDAVAAHRHSLGVPATAIGWGVWSAGGAMTAHVDAAERVRLNRRGVGSVATEAGVDLMVQLASRTNVAHRVVQQLEVTALRSQALAGTLPPLLSTLIPVPQRRAAAAGWRVQLDAVPSGHRERLLTELLRSQAAGVIGHDSAQAVPADRAFKDLGFDSLTAVELRNRIGTHLQIRLPATVAFEQPTAAALARYLLDEIYGATAPAVAGPARTPAGQQSATASGQDDDPIVIVGMGCRYPGDVTSPADLWGIVADRIDATGDFPADRGWDLDALFNDDPDHRGTTYTRRGGFLSSPADFDAEFFGMSPREALATDPQHRLLLQVTWEALERAGIDPVSLKGSDTGVFIGAMYDDYATRLDSAPTELEGLLLAGNQSSIASGRIAYVLGLGGRALTIDTACSSSLVALDLAVRAVRSGECGRALAGGVAVMASPTMFIEFARQRGLSPDGRCRAFGDGADGTGWAEGVGVVVVERLSVARAEGHPVLAVVAGSAVNSDGASNGLTAPSGTAQERVLRAALADAGLGPHDVDVVEGHGTGTTLGDPIEARALISVYGADRKQPLLLGSLKSNIGHAQAAAGIGGVIKMVEALRRGVVPATLWADRPSEHVEWAGSGVSLAVTESPWPDHDRPRRAGVSSFGISGTNAHVIVQSPPDTSVTGDRSDTHESGSAPLLLSARTAPALRTLAAGLLPLVQDASPDDPRWRSVAHVMAHRRSRFTHRAAVADSAALSALASGQTHRALGQGIAAERIVAALFSGQGSQYPGMGVDLLAQSSSAAAAFESAAKVIDPLLGVRLVDILGDGQRLSRTEFAQPALFALELAGYAELARLGIGPSILIGHSIGELAAAHIAGVVDLPDAAKLVVARGRLMQSAPPGAMAAVEVGESEAQELAAAAGIDVAAINGPTAAVLSGAADAIDAVLAQVIDRGHRATRLKVAHAFHSSHLDPILTEFGDVCAALNYQPPEMTVVSTLTGEVAGNDIASADYWVQQVRHRVRFADAVRSAHGLGANAFVEIGPDGRLAAAAGDTVDEENVVTAALLDPRRGSDETVPALERSLFVAGIDAETNERFGPVDTREVTSILLDAPTYPFAAKRYWIEPAPRPTAGAAALGLEPSPHSMLGALVPLPDGGSIAIGVWSVSRYPWFADHQINEQIVVPATVFIDVFAALIGPRLAELTLTAPLTVDHARAVRVLVGHDGEATVQSRPAEAGVAEAEWITHATARAATSTVDPHADLATDATRGSGAITIGHDEFYESLRERSFDYGPRFRGVSGIWRRDDSLSADVEVPTSSPDGTHVAPGFLDAALHPLTILSPNAIPFSLQGIRVSGNLTRSGRVAVARNADGSMRVRVVDSVGADVTAIDSVRLRELAGEADLYHIDWIPAVPGDVGPNDGRAIAPLTVDISGVEDALAAATALPAEGDRRIFQIRNFPFAGDDQPDTTAAAAWGLLRVAQTEYPDQITLVGTDGSSISGDLLATLAALPSGSVAAVRNGELLRPTLTPQNPTVDHSRAIGAVLITGGTGALGTAIAEHLCSQHRVNQIVLASRTGSTTADLPEQVTVVSCDVTNEQAIADLLREHGPFDTVIHAAAISNDAVLEHISTATVDESLSVKVGSAEIIDRLTRDAATRLVLFGSVASVLGTAGQGAYAAANTALESVASARRRSGNPATVVHWGLWDTGNGLAGQISELDRVRLARKGIHAMTMRDGLGLLDRILAEEPHTVVAANLNIHQARRQLSPVARAQAEPAGTTADGGELPTGRPTEEWVLDAIAAILGHDSGADIDRTRPFTELGFDSLMAVELRNRLNQELAHSSGPRLGTAVVFDYPTPQTLIEHIRSLAVDKTPEPLNVPTTDTPDDAVTDTDTDPVVIVGMACRLPGDIETPAQLWELLDAGGDAITDFPDDRGWPHDLYDPDPSHQGTSSVRRGGFIHDAAEFDPEFFGISPREALAIDPQQRLLLETAWTAIEDAGIDPRSLAGSNSGVFVGVMYSDYGARIHQRGGGGEMEGWLVAGSAGSVASGRVAYTLGLQGPAVTVDTACSSSLVSIHQAAQALRSKECDLALAGGATVMSSPATFIEFSRQRGLAPDGRCKPFSADADGTAWSEGAGLVVLERLSDARRNGHRVLAVVAGSAVNSDGTSNGLTAPNGPAQQRVIRRALDSARLTPQQIDVLEAHGTGTRLGDPIEADAVLAAYGDRAGRSPLIMGSAKSNLGHTQAAAGVVGVIKLVESMARERVPGTAHLGELTPHVQWSDGSVVVPASTVPWPDNGQLRRAAVSAFGISGTNTHVILESPPAESDTADRSAYSPPAQATNLVLWTLSAPTQDQLSRIAGNLARHIRSHPELATADIAHTLTRRSVFAVRAAILGTTRQQLLDGLDSLSSGHVHRADAERGTELPLVVSGERVAGSIGLVFTGQGSQRVAMGAQLAAEYREFAEVFDQIADEFARHDIDIREAIAGTDAGQLDQTRYTQAAIFAFEVALARLLQAWGLRPDAVAGHSIGEVSAAHIAGALSLADAVRLVSVRGTLMQELPTGGAMASIRGVTHEDVIAAVQDSSVDIAAINSPTSLVVAGPERAVAELIASHDWRTSMLKVSHAFHSSLMEPMLEQLADIGLAAREPDTAVYSTLTGSSVTATELGSGRHWADQVRGTVLFAATVQQMAAGGAGLFIEVGPDAALTPMVAESATDAVVIAAQTRRVDERQALWAAVARGFVAGVAWDFDHLTPGRLIALPTYPFAKQRYWLDAPIHKGVDHGDGPVHPLLDMGVAIPDTDRSVYAGTVSLRRHPWLAGHVVGDSALLPAVAVIDVFGELARWHGRSGLSEVVLTAPLVISDDDVAIRIGVDGTSVTLHARDADTQGWVQHAYGTFVDTGADPASAAGGHSDVDAWTGGIPAEAEPVRWSYDELAEQGYHYGGDFASLDEVSRSGDVIYARAQSTGTVGSLDAVLQAWLTARGSDTSLAVPYAWSGVESYAAPRGPVRGRIIRTSPDTLTLDVCDDTGTAVLHVDEIRMRSVDPALSTPRPYELRWVAQPLRRDLGSPRPVSNTTVIVAHPDQSPREAFAAVRSAILELGDDERLVVITRGAVAAVDGDLVDHPEQAVLWGLIRTAISEHSGQVSVIDVDDVPATADIVDRVIESTIEQAAVRSGQVYVPRLARLQDRSSAIVFEPGTVVVTGAGGALGGAITRHLVHRHGVTRLVLVSRRGPDDPVLAALAAELLPTLDYCQVVACDLAEAAAVEELLSPIEDLAGVVHAAGVVSDAVLSTMTDTDIDTVFRAKVDAALNLHRVLVGANCPLVLFSSIAGLVGNAGQANYAAANSFLDALATHRQAAGLPTISLAWGLWEADTGMGGHLDAASRARIDRLGLRAATAGQGLAHFDAALASGAAIAVPAILRPQPGGPELFADLLPRQAEAVPDGPVAPDLRAQIAGLDTEAARDVVRGRLAAAIAAVLGRSVTSVPDDIGLFDLGMDSLMAVELRGRLGDIAGETLPATVVFDHPTASALTDLVVQRCHQPEQIDQVNIAQADRQAPPQPDAVIEQWVTAAGRDDRAREELGEALRAALARLDLPLNGDFGDDSVSDDELFGMLDRELNQ